MGGVPTNYHGEVVQLRNGDPESVVRGLYAVGEAACVSVHGANRLGSNSLLDLVVFGRAAAQRAAEVVKPGAPHKRLPANAGEIALTRLDKFRNAKGGTRTAQLRLKMQRAMQDHCAVFRTRDSLKEGIKKIESCRQEMADLQVTDRSMIWNSDLMETLELDNLMAQSQVAIVSAENRTESRGAHAREDFKDRDDKNWMKHTVIYADDKGKTNIVYRPVHLYTMSNDVEVVAPKARVY